MVTILIFVLLYCIIGCTVDLITDLYPVHDEDHSFWFYIFAWVQSIVLWPVTLWMIFKH